jgi:hypothetical protein
MIARRNRGLNTDVRQRTADMMTLMTHMNAILRITKKTSWYESTGMLKLIWPLRDIKNVNIKSLQSLADKVTYVYQRLPSCNL